MKVVDNARSKQLELDKFPTYRTYNFGEKLILHVILVHISNMKVSLSLDVRTNSLNAIQRSYLRFVEPHTLLQSVCRCRCLDQLRNVPHGEVTPFVPHGEALACGA